LPSSEHLAVDAMNRYNSTSAISAAKALAQYRLRWFEDMCDPLDFETHKNIALEFATPLGAGEAIFSLADAKNLLRYGGLRRDRDVLLFDPAHSYGLPEYLKIIETLESNGWSRKSFVPHGGHLFSLHVAAALGLGGSESNPHNFQPFGGFTDESIVENGTVHLPEAPGIGFEKRSSLYNVFCSLL
jgi:D(-)-tartrate dehydratase